MRKLLLSIVVLSFISCQPALATWECCQEGPQGEKGDKGDKGDRGARGKIGTSIQGIAGGDGLDGIAGTDGTDGVSGANGATGIAGKTGAQGRTGATGDKGEQGQRGEPGKDADANAGIAGALAFSMLEDAYKGGNVISVGGGTYEGESAAAIGVGKSWESGWSAKAGAFAGRDGVGGAVSGSFHF